MLITNSFSQRFIHCFGLVAAALILISLSFFIYSIHVITTIYLYSRFQNAMVMFYHDKDAASEFLTDPALFYFPKAQKITLEKTLLLLSDIDDHHFQGARKLINEKLIIPNDIKQPLLKDLSNALSLESELSAIKSMIAEAQQKHQTLTAEYLSIRNQLRNFLDLPQDNKADDIQYTDNDFYNSSLLDSFPRIAEYPDGIIDQQLINQALQKSLQQQDTAPGSDNIAMTPKSLEALRTRSFELKHEFGRLAENKKQIAHKQAEKEEVLRNQINAMRGQVLEIISVRTRPKFRNSYFNLYDSLTRWLPNLPSVRSHLLPDDVKPSGPNDNTEPNL